MCPLGAIHLRIDKTEQSYFPTIDEAKCNNCSLCVRICPGHEVNFRQLNLEIFGKNPSANITELLIGNYRNCYTGYSTDSKIRYDSSSGGMITQLLVFALEEGIIDGALVTKMDKERPLEPHPFIARTREEILEASRSKYCPVPANVALREILNLEGKYAVTGLPCHIHGLRKAERLDKMLRERVFLHMGLFCARNESFLQTEYLLYRWGVNVSDVARIDYRGNGWPGISTVKLRSGGEKNCNYTDWTPVQQSCAFALARCLLCCDGTSELADISFGDAWLPELSNDRIGTSIIVARTQDGERILQEASRSKKVHLKRVNALEVLRSQGMMRFKKNALPIRSALFRMRRKKIPFYNVELPRQGFVDYPRSIAIYFSRFLASRRDFWGVLDVFMHLQDPLRRTHQIISRASSKIEE
jgi:coenzyme F420 hydrogenase subunit beta